MLGAVLDVEHKSFTISANTEVPIVSNARAGITMFDMPDQNWIMAVIAWTNGNINILSSYSTDKISQTAGTANHICVYNDNSLKVQNNLSVDITIRATSIYTRRTA